MQGEFKQCPNGHYYQGENCPYCKSSNQVGNGASSKTEIFVGGGYGYDYDGSTINVGSGVSNGDTETIIMDGQTNSAIDVNLPPVHKHTVFGDDEEEILGANTPHSANRTPSHGRKLVGWLVTYSFDPLGADYKLYEGRNFIGRDADCNITINDGSMSGKHAVLLFRANKYSLTDQQSSHGTFVNDDDIELEPRYLKDGDEIRMGKTTFKFRTSL